MLKDKKSKQLGMSYSTAGNRLKKMLFFKLVQETKKDRCFRCDEKITNYIELSIDHMDAWLDQDNSVFWNLNNIAYSHLTCNSAKSATSSINKHPSYNSYSSGCRCDACTMCKMMYQRYSRWKKDKYG